MMHQVQFSSVKYREQKNTPTPSLSLQLLFGYFLGTAMGRGRDGNIAPSWARGLSLAPRLPDEASGREPVPGSPEPGPRLGPLAH